jgi:hypothetical protein
VCEVFVSDVEPQLTCAARADVIKYGVIADKRVQREEVMYTLNLKEQRESS